MTATTTTTQALIGWINETRLNAPVLDNDADALLARMGSSQKTESMVTPVFATPILTTSWLA
ncbi:virulence protein [Enterobacter asburiae]|nr:virulence protein [Enterobacter asburiae]